MMFHLKRWKNFCVSEFLKKEIEPIFIEIVKVCVSSIQYEGIEIFWDRKLCMNFIV